MPEPGEVLSEREIEVLRLVATGASNDQIARELVISPNTVKVHLRNIFTKLGVASRTEASLYAIRQGWVQVPTNAVPVPEEPVAAIPEKEPLSEPPQVVTPPVPAPRWRLFLAIGVLGALLLAVLILSLIDGWPPHINATPTVGSTGSEFWSARSEMVTPRSDLALVSFGGKLYAIAGRGAKGASAAVECFDPQENSWTSLADKPTATWDVQGAGLGGKIYVPGGCTDSGRPIATTEVYEVELNRWRSAAALPRPLCAYALVAFEGKLYLFGGKDDTQYSDEILRYNPDLDRWDAAGKLPLAYAYAAAVVVDNRILVLGGTGADGPTNLRVDYTPSLGTWTVQPLVDTPLDHTQAVVLGEFLYVLSESAGKPPQLWSITPVRSTSPKWQQKSSNLHPGMAVAAVGATRAYFVGGREQDTTLATTEEFVGTFTVVIPAPTSGP